MIDVLKNKGECCGCEGCIQGCPVNCINLVEDEEGFKYPLVDKTLCINCSKCEKICPIISKENISNNLKIKVFAGFDNSKNRMNSTSGGVFGVIAEYIIKNKGIVFGAAFDENFEVKHIGIESLDELNKLRGSKYVQSSINGTYKLAKKYLDQDRFVLFSGVPCQIYGLYNFLGKEYKNLYTCGIVCHGVPSPKVFRDYIEYLKNKNKASIKEIRFRDKINGWNNSRFSVTFTNGKVYSNEIGKDAYANAFLCDLYSRPSCHKCYFKELPNKSDFLLGDFWGIETEKPHLNDNKGVSLIITNQRGEEILNKLKNNITIEYANIDHALKRNPYLLKSALPDQKRNDFMMEYSKNKEFKYILKKYMNPMRSTLRNRIIFKLKRIINK